MGVPRGQCNKEQKALEAQNEYPGLLPKGPWLAHISSFVLRRPEVQHWTAAAV